MGAGDIFWWWFWVVSFAVAGASFASIAVVVTIRGVGDLRTMIQLLQDHTRQ